MAICWRMWRTIYMATFKIYWPSYDRGSTKRIRKEGDVPGPFKYPKRAREMYDKALSKRASLVFTNKIFAYALAVSEEKC